MRIDLTGQTAVVTGSTAGIGFAIARGLGAAGASVVLNGPTEALVDDALARLRAEAPDASARGVAADLSTAEGAAALVAAAPSADILVNNLGIYAAGDIFDTLDAEWMRFLETNLMSAVRLSRALMPGMAARNRGRVVFLSSESALAIPPDMIPYAVTKTALLALSRGLAKRVAGTAVTVNAVLPGPTLSEGLVALLEPDRAAAGVTLEAAAAAFIARHRPGSLLRRPATVEEVASLVVYLASPQASATTGAALRVDGGVLDAIV